MAHFTAVHFRCRSNVNFGDKLVVVGSAESLGNWDFAHCHELVASNNIEDVWNSGFPVYLPLKQYVEYRYAVLSESNQFLRWNDELVRHIEPTGNEMIVEDDEGYFRAACSGYGVPSGSVSSYTADGGSLDGRLAILGAHPFTSAAPPGAHESSAPEPGNLPSAESVVYFVTSRLPLQVYRKLDGSFGIRESNTPLTAMFWELRNRFRNKMKFVGACCIRFESEQDVFPEEFGTFESSSASSGVRFSTAGCANNDAFHTSSNGGFSQEALNGTHNSSEAQNGAHNYSDPQNKTHNSSCPAGDTTTDSSSARLNGSAAQPERPLKDQFTEAEQHQIRELLSSYGCIPVFIPLSEMRSSIVFCKKYMWNLFYNIGLWDIYEQNEFDWELWQAYCKVNKYYASVVSQYVGGDDFTWVHDYKLLMVPHFLSRKCKTANIGLFMHALFPSYTLFACLAVREEVLRSMLCADLIGFHFFEFAKHFLTSCKRILGLDYNFSTGGMIGIEYNGRQVMIRMNRVHIQADLLDSKVFSSSHCSAHLDPPTNGHSPNCSPTHTGSHSPLTGETHVQRLANQLRLDWPDRFIVASVDRDVRLSGLLLKFKAFRKFLQNYPYARGKILLVQYICTIDTLWQGHSDVSRKLTTLADDINREFQTTHVVVKINTNYAQKYSLFLASDCFMDTSIRGGINLCAFEYVYCRKGKPALSIISEFTGFSKTLVSAIRVNPWHTDNVMEALDTALSLSTEQATELCRKDVAYIESNDAISWVDHFITELYHSRKKQDMLHTSWGFGKTYKTLSFASNFQLLDYEFVVSRFENSRRKLLFLDCEGTLCFNPYDVPNRFYKPDRETRSVPLPVNIENLKKLSKDKNTVIVLISSRNKQVMDNWFRSLPNVGLCAERGYHFKLPAVFGHTWKTMGQAGYGLTASSGGPGRSYGINLGSSYQVNLSASYGLTSLGAIGRLGNIRGLGASGGDEGDEGDPSDNWRVVAEQLFEQYVQRTPGSYLESKDSCIVFQFQNSDQEFGMLQANELNTALSLLMDGFPVDIHKGKGFLEVRLKGVNKGNALLHVVSKYSSIYGDFDFILCLGDDRSDEESFRALETLKRSHMSNINNSPNFSSSMSVHSLHSSHPGSMEGSRHLDSLESSERNSIRDSYISCVVGKRPSKANYYLNDYLEVPNLLSALANNMD